MNKTPPQNKKYLIIWMIAFAIPAFIVTVYLMHMVVLAYLFSTRPLHGAGFFPYLIYAIPWIVAIVVALLFALVGRLIGLKMLKQQEHHSETRIWLITLIVFIAAAVVGGGFCWWQKNINKELQTEKGYLYNQLANKKEGLIFPDYMAPEQISWLKREGGNTIYAVSRPLATSLRYLPGYSLDKSQHFIGMIKSTDNGETWQNVYETENDILDFSLVEDKYLYLVTVSRYGGGSGEMFIKIATSRDGGSNWTTSDEIAKNDVGEEHLKQPLIYGTTSNLIIDQKQPNHFYLLYKERIGDTTFNKTIYTKDFGQTWERKDLTEF